VGAAIWLWASLSHRKEHQHVQPVHMETDKTRVSEELPGSLLWDCDDMPPLFGMAGRLDEDASTTVMYMLPTFQKQKEKTPDGLGLLGADATCRHRPARENDTIKAVGDGRVSFADFHRATAKKSVPVLVAATDKNFRWPLRRLFKSTAYFIIFQGDDPSIRKV